MWICVVLCVYFWKAYRFMVYFARRTVDIEADIGCFQANANHRAAAVVKSVDIYDWIICFTLSL